MSDVKFTRVSKGEDILFQVFDGDDGFEYLAAMAPRAVGMRSLDNAIEALRPADLRWSLIESNIHTVEIEDPLGVPGISKEPGPVVCALYRRVKQ